MEFVYHGAPREMVGDVLYPLDQLAAVHPGLYAVQKSKYDGREQVMAFQVPHLNRGFTDTVHCAPIHPYRLFSARWALGFDPPRQPEGTHFSGLFFEIPLERILACCVVWYRWETLWINGAPGEDVPFAPPADEFEPFDALRYRRLSAVPSAHLDYLRRMKARGERGLLFVHVPHGLVAGPIDASGLRPIAWDKLPTCPTRETRALHAL